MDLGNPDRLIEKGGRIMLDRIGRKIEYLRISITERCNLKCIYCRDASEHCKAKNEMTVKEIERIVKQMVSLGITKVRLSGGEPMIRKDLEEIVSVIARNKEIRDICMTTNGFQLSERAKTLRRAGLTRLNISLDSLKDERYYSMTRGGKIQNVLDGIQEALSCGYETIKINTVLIRGENDDEIDDFIELARQMPIDVRFIELMPIGTLGQDSHKRVCGDEVLRERPYLKPIKPRYPSQPSEDYTGEGFLGRVGLIRPMSHKFCHICNRVRLTSDAKLKLCLGNNSEKDLKVVLQGSDEYLRNVIRQAILAKPLSHCFEDPFASVRTMNRIGG